MPTCWLRVSIDTFKKFYISAICKETPFVLQIAAEWLLSAFKVLVAKGESGEKYIDQYLVRSNGNLGSSVRRTSFKLRSRANSQHQRGQAKDWLLRDHHPQECGSGFLYSAWTKKPLFQKIQLKSRKIIFKIFSVKEKSTYFLVYHPLFGIMPINHKLQAHLPCG